MMTTLALAAMDATVVGTALPTIVGQLGGLQLLGWVFSAYLLTSTVAVPFAAKLADTVGRRPVYLASLGIFIAASVAAGFSPSMPMLIFFRALQGIGGGALTTAAFTIIGDAFEPRQRARVQALFGAVWAVSSVLGPALGGLITTTVGWPWVFEINLPVGLLAGGLVMAALREADEADAHDATPRPAAETPGPRGSARALDWLGGLLLTAAVVCLLLAASEAPATFGWVSAPTFGLLGGAAVLIYAFVRVERRVPEPIVNLALLRHRVIRPGLIVQALGGFILFGLTSFVPPMVQGVHGRSAFEAGLVVGTLTLGWPFGSFVGGRALLRWGARAVVLVGASLAAVGTAILTQLQSMDAPWLAALGPVVTGLGIGAMSVTVMVTVQSAVDWRERGVVTGLTQFARTIAGTVGVGVMGGVLAAFTGAASSDILDPVQRAAMSPAELEASRVALAAGLTWIYWAMFALAALMLVAVVRTMPDIRLGAGRQVEVR